MAGYVVLPKGCWDAGRPAIHDIAPVFTEHLNRQNDSTQEQ